MQKKSILIATPGQTEQEYLSIILLQQKMAFTVSQNKFDIITAIQNAKQFSYSSISFPVFDQEKLKQLLMGI